MDRYGYVKVAAISPRTVYIGNPLENEKVICKYIDIAVNRGAEVIVFPELCITGYTCGDLFNQSALLDAAEIALGNIAEHTKKYAHNVIVAVGMPIRWENQLFNCAVIIESGQILAVIPKTHIPNYNEFYEMRYFSSSCSSSSRKEIEILGQDAVWGPNTLIKCKNVAGKDFVIGVEICEDAWAPVTPGALHCIFGADIILNLSASNELTAKKEYRRRLISTLSAQEISGYVYASASKDESTSDTVYSGHLLICENGKILRESSFKENNDNAIIISDIDVEKLRADRRRSTSYMQKAFNDSHLVVRIENWRSTYSDMNSATASLMPFVPKNIKERAEEILTIQASGLSQRLKKTGIKKVVLGISGGLDSTLALLACVKAFKINELDLSGIIGITMPGFGTTKRTLDNSLKLMECIGITSRTIDIKAACEQHLKDIGHPMDVFDIAYENVQARERTQVLMDVANMEGALVIGTGDLSELAIGWCTYNGDHMSMYAVNCSIPKTLVRHLVKYYADECYDGETADCLNSILDTPVSPELLPPNKDGTIAQKTEDSIGNYTIHDFTLYYMLRFGFSPEKIFNLFMNSAISSENDEWKNISKMDVVHNMMIFYRRFFSQQFKRNCVPDGIKVGSISLSPRADLRMPSDATGKLWMDELKKMEEKIIQGDL